LFQHVEIIIQLQEVIRHNRKNDIQHDKNQKKNNVLILEKSEYVSFRINR